MPRTFKDNEKIKEERKNKILDISLRLFAGFGYENVSMDMIAKKAKCSHGLMYHYFKDKNEILKAHYDRIKDDLCKDVHKIMEENESGEKFLLAVLKLPIDYINKNIQSAYYIYLFADRLLDNFSTDILKSAFDKEVDKYFKDSFKKEFGVADISKNRNLFHNWLLYVSFIKSLAEDKIKYSKVLSKDFDYTNILLAFLNKGDK
ncbi:MAG: TetR/AcrR family transcriptional regulator [Bacilli bacterium]|nr:TetR/AcrR family transcriptional regulator [Bacilli bacterium]